MESSFLTINEAASFIDKSDVTIRRLIKRLRKNRTSETDRSIVEATEHGKRLYRIDARFLVQHANLNAATRDRLLRQLEEMTSQTVNDKVLSSQNNDLTSELNTQTASTFAYNHDQTDQPARQTTRRPTQVNGHANDDESVDQSVDRSRDQTIGKMPSQKKEIDSALLKEAMDELRSQLKNKDNQIGEKDKQLAAKDETIDGLNKSIQQLTKGIEQGNFLVASAQQRIPLPESAKRENMSTPEDEPTADESVVSDHGKLERGLWQRIISGFQRNSSD